jgi:hypothetical protein
MSYSVRCLANRKVNENLVDTTNTRELRKTQNHLKSVQKQIIVGGKGR